MMRYRTKFSLTLLGSIAVMACASNPSAAQNAQINSFQDLMSYVDAAEKSGAVIAQNAQNGRDFETLMNAVSRGEEDLLLPSPPPVEAVVSAPPASTSIPQDAAPIKQIEPEITTPPTLQAIEDETIEAEAIETAAADNTARLIAPADAPLADRAEPIISRAVALPSQSVAIVEQRTPVIVNAMDQMVSAEQLELIASLTEKIRLLEREKQSLRGALEYKKNIILPPAQ